MSLSTASHAHERECLVREAPMAAKHTVDFADDKNDLGGDRFNCKPVILRTIPLLSLFVLSLVFIGLLQWAVVQLPLAEDRLRTLFRGGHEKRDWDIFARQDSAQAQASQSSTPAKVSSTDTTTTQSDVSSSPSEAPTSSAETSNYLDQDRTTTLEATTDQTAYLTPSKTGAYSTAHSAYLDPSAYLDQDQTATLATTTGSAYLTLKETFTIAPSAPISQYLQTGKTITPSPASAASAAPSDYVQTKDIIAPQQSPATSVFLVVSTLQSAVIVPVTQSSSDRKTVQSNSQSAHLTQGDHTRISPDPTNIESAFSTAYVPVVVTSTVTSTSGGQQPTLKSGQDGADSDSIGHGKSAVVVIAWNNSQIFLSTYLAVLLAVIYRLLFSVVHNNLTRIEPFRQLTEPNGALASSALFNFYHRQSGLLGPISALRNGRWALAIVGTAYLAASLLPALASEAIWVDTNWNCPADLRKPEERNNPCPARMTASEPVIRVLQGLLAFAAAVILGLASLLLLRKSGLPADPSSIATVSSLMRHPGFLEDMSELPTGAGATHENMKSAMDGKRYCIGAWAGSRGRGYGLRPMNDVDSGAASQRSPSIYSKTSSGYTPVDSRSSFNEADIVAQRWRWMDFVLIIFILGTFGVVLGYYLDGNDDGFNRFFSSNTFGPRFILTGSGTLIANMWNVVEESSVVMMPFIRLSKGPASARDTITFEPSSTPIVSTWRALRCGYWSAAVVSITTLLGEVLNLVISGVPYATAQTWQQFLISAYMSIAILSIMTLVSAGVIFNRKHEPRIPVHPDTLGAKMSYLAGARMLDDFEGAEFERPAVRDDRLRLLGKHYEFKPAVRKDGRRTWLVDETHDQRGGYQSI
ncbi:hypothetical protein AC578_10310 [Pseudocercospora eumusae]|uniref:Uncharacterized protein n=1 Tax=Pseudocercospora eumusae TaxID=321146 RepID=A0A139HRB3_9PEZI|nr:hypothetical protein AC578_10310 [Pseudocercospora eumusae]